MSKRQKCLMRNPLRVSVMVICLLIGLMCIAKPVEATTLGISNDGRFFTIDGKPTFLLGVSYFAALSATWDDIVADLTDMKADGFNWIRVMMFYDAWGSGDVSVMTREGQIHSGVIENRNGVLAHVDETPFRV